MQIGKILGASKVIGITVSAEKCEWLKEIGVDLAYDYHDPEWQTKFANEVGYLCVPRQSATNTNKAY